MFRFYTTHRNYSAKIFHNNMKQLWQEYSETVVQLINHSIANSDVTNQWLKKLYNTQQLIANGIIKFYGEREALSNLFNYHIHYLNEAIDIFLLKKDVGSFRKIWFGKADELSNLLDSMSEWNIRNYFYKQIFIIESMIKSFIKKDTEAIKYYREQLIINNASLSLTLTNGIIKDNSKSFY